MSEGYYGRNGALGLATPQANPTAETEFRALMPQGVACATVRMVSAEPDPATRLRAYFTDIGQTLDGFDTLSLQAIGLACTGSTYLLGYEAVEALLGELSSKRGQPVISAAASIESALAHLGASSIALICPYPEWLLTAAESHWRARGYDVVDQFSLDSNQGDTRAIYALSPEVAGEKIRARWQDAKADAYLITGTGLPTLRVVSQLSESLSGPVLSSNLCLAWASLQAAGIDLAERAPTPSSPLLGGWEHLIDGL